MSEEKNIDEVIEEVDAVVDEEAEVKSEGILTKAARGLKKHGKQVAAFAAVTAVGLIGYALGSRSKESNICEPEDTGVYYLDDHSSENSTSESGEVTEE